MKLALIVFLIVLLIIFCIHGRERKHVSVDIFYIIIYIYIYYMYILYGLFLRVCGCTEDVARNYVLLS